MMATAHTPNATGRRLLFFSLLACLLIPHPSPSQVLPFESYSVRDGLLSNDVRCITQDSEGYLWIGTRDGVSVFDGHRFMNYTVNDGLSPGFIQDIVEDLHGSEKTLWLLGARGMLSRWTRGVCERFLYDSTVSWMHRITSIVVDHAGTLWAGTEDTLVQIVDGKVKPVHVGLAVRYPHLMREQGDSVMWIASRSGLLRYDTRSRRFENVPLETFDPSHINAILFGARGEVRIGLDPGWILTLRRSTIVDRRRTGAFDFFTMDHREDLWFGSYSGLYRITGSSDRTTPIEHFTTRNGLAENTLKDAFVDREGNLWLGGISQGVVKLTDDRILRFPLDGINPPYQFSIAASDRNDHLWVIGSMRLWEIWRAGDGSWRRYEHRGPPGAGPAPPFQVYDTHATDTEAHPYAVFCASAETLWVVFSNAQIVGYRIESGDVHPSHLRRIRVLRAGIEVPHVFPKAMIVDRRGFIWYSCGSSILQIDPRKEHPLVRAFTEVPMWPGRNYARVLYEDGAGNIWAGFFLGGVMRLPREAVPSGAFRPVPAPDGGPGDAITAIAQDPAGRVLIGTEGRGMIIVEGGDVRRAMVPQGLPSNTILSIVTGSDTRTWLGTSVGICTMEHADPGTAIQPARFKGEMAVASGRTRNGLLWFATRSGVLLYDLRREGSPLPSPLVSIVSFRVNGKGRDIRDDVHLSPTENTCTIGFVAPTFRDPGLIRYSYRLLGSDTGWSPPQSHTEVTFASLPPDSYEFNVRAIVAGSATVSNVALVRFTIVPPIWKRWWFAVLAWSLAFLVIAAIVRYVEKKKLMARVHALELQQVLDRERLRVSQDMHDEVGSALTEIVVLSQMARRRPEATGMYVNEIGDRAAEVIDTVSEIVWAMNPRNDSLENVIAHCRRHAVKYLSATEIRCTVSFPDVLPPCHLNAEFRRNLFLVVKEALHNVVKHASASRVTLTLTVDGGVLVLSIEDDGRGFPSGMVGEGGNGLRNMERRMATIGGSCEVLSVPGNGTRIAIRLPLAMNGLPEIT